MKRLRFRIFRLFLHSLLNPPFYCRTTIIRGKREPEPGFFRRVRHRYVVIRIGRHNKENRLLLTWDPPEKFGIVFEEWRVEVKLSHYRLCNRTAGEDSITISDINWTALIYLYVAAAWR